MTYEQLKDCYGRCSFILKTKAASKKLKHSVEVDQDLIREAFEHGIKDYHHDFLERWRREFLRPTSIAKLTPFWIKETRPVIGYPFVDYVDQNARPEIRDPVDWLRMKYRRGSLECGIDNLTSSGFYKLSGYSYDFRPYLTHFVFLQHGNWQGSYAPNKSLLRAAVYGSIDKILINE